MHNILVIDDDKAILDLCKLLLGRAGYEVRTAADGKSGLAMARQDRPDLIILDVMMPELDGISVSGVLFQDPVLRLIPVLILTAKNSARNILELVPNVRVYVQKPFEPQELLAQVQRLLPLPNSQIRFNVK